MNNDLNNTNIVEIPRNEDMDKKFGQTAVLNLDEINKDNKSDNNTDKDNSFYEKDRKVWPIILVIIILLICGLVAFYYFVLTKPSNIVDKMFSETKKSLKSAKTIEDFKKMDSIKSKSTLYITTNNEAYKEYNDIRLSYDIGYDFNNQDNNYFDFEIKQGKDSLYGFSFSLLNNKLYLDLKDKYTNVLYTPFDNVFKEYVDGYLKNSEKTADYMLYLIDVMLDSVKNNISIDKVTKKMLIKDINNKKVPAIEYNYVIDYPEFKKLYNGIFNGYINDSDAVSKMSYLFSVSQSDMLSVLNTLKNELSDMMMNGNINVSFSIDAIKNNLLEIKVNDDSTNFLLTNDDSEIKVNLNNEKDLELNATADKKEKKLFLDIKYSIDDDETLRLSINGKENEITDSKENVSYSVTIYDLSDINKELITISAENENERNVSINHININDAVDFEEINGTDQEYITSLILPIYSMINGEDEFEEYDDYDYSLEFED